MSKSLKQQLEQLRVHADNAADHRIRREIDRAWNQYRQTEHEPANRPVWRTIMKNKVALTAAAAILLLIVLLPALIPSGVSQPAWAEIIQPVMQAQNAELTIIVGESGSSPKIRDQVLGSRIRRIVDGIDAVTILDLETSKILTLEPHTKTATLIDMENLPQIPNYLEHLRNLLVSLENAPHFEIEYLGQQTLDDGTEVLAMNINYQGGYLYMAIHPETYAPVQVDQHEGQLHILCRDIRFNVDLDPALFSMDVPEGYTTNQTQIDLKSGTEENFIWGLRLWTQYIGDGYFPEDVRIESYLQVAAKIGRKLEASGLTQEEQQDVGMAMGPYLLFIRFYRGEGPWTYAGRGVQYGDPDTPIFWYKPDKTEPYHVIYADLHVEKVENAEDLPPAPEPYDAVPALSVSRATGGFTSDSENSTWHVQSEGRLEVRSELTLTVPDDASSLPVTLPYARGELTSVLLNDQAVPFTAAGEGKYDIPLTQTGRVSLLCAWTLPLDALEKWDSMYRIELKGLLPTADFEVIAVLEEDCGYTFTDMPDQSQLQLFSIEADNPDIYFGSCGLPIAPTP